MAKLILISAYGVFLLVELAVALKEGEACSINNQKGTCRLKSACPEYSRLRELGIRASICAYDAGKLIICCPDSGEIPQDKLRVSEQYCRQWRKLVSEEIRYKGLAIGDGSREELVPVCDETLPLIIGGQESKLGEFPHMAALGWRDNDTGITQFTCGGSLISDRYVLTAAHCLRTTGMVPTVVRLGDHDLYSTVDNLDHVTVDIEEIVVHTDHKSSRKYNDIALLRLSHPVTFGPNIRPACLWPFAVSDRTSAVAIGYGSTETYGPSSKVLRKVKLEVLEKDRCATLYKNFPKLPHSIKDSQLCFHSPEGGKDTCTGDSGGPIQVTVPDYNCLYYIVGITSFGSSCGVRGSAGVYTNVAFYLDWIESVVWPEAVLKLP